MAWDRDRAERDVARAGIPRHGFTKGLLPPLILNMGRANSPGGRSTWDMVPLNPYLPGRITG